MIRRPPRSTLDRSSAASDVYKRQVLGNLLGLPGFDQETVEEVRAQALGDVTALAQRLDNSCSLAFPYAQAQAPDGLERVSDVPIYASDATVRRAVPLQLTADARAPVVGLSTAQWQRLGLQAGDTIRVASRRGEVTLQARRDDGTPAGTELFMDIHPGPNNSGFQNPMSSGRCWLRGCIG